MTAGAVLAFRLSEHQQQRVPERPEPQVPDGVADVLAVLGSSALVVGDDERVLKASAAAYSMGLLADDRFQSDELLDLIRKTRRDGEVRAAQLVFGAGPRALSLAARVAPLGSRLVLVLIEDRTREKRVDEIRRDFVANVSHELKTPVGAITLLSEAVGEAADDPEAVVHFAGRMRVESERLTRLVQQIIELSRLQGDDPLDDPDVVPVDAVVESAIDRVGVDAASKSIAVVSAGRRGEHVLGSKSQIAVAIGNLVENAVAYSPSQSKVTVAVARSGDNVDIVVTDQGVGIPAREIDRIFERFYRLDPARARDTGGTGLGLSIVKHVAATNGGDVRVWSEEGSGSSFTLRLRAHAPADSNAPANRLDGPNAVEKRQHLEVR